LAAIDRYPYLPIRGCGGARLSRLQLIQRTVDLVCDQRFGKHSVVQLLLRQFLPTETG